MGVVFNNKKIHERTNDTNKSKRQHNNDYYNNNNIIKNNNSDDPWRIFARPLQLKVANGSSSPIVRPEQSFEGFKLMEFWCLGSARTVNVVDV